MNRTLVSYGTAALIGGTLLLGGAPAHASPDLACPSTMHHVDPATNGGADCAPNSLPTEPLASGPNWSIWEGPATYAPAPAAPPAAPARVAPAAPQAPIVPVPAPAAAPRVNVAPGGSRTVPAPNQAPAESYVPEAVAPTWVVPSEGQAPVEAAPAAPVEPAAVVLPVSEAQAVDVLRSVTAAPAAKDAALAIVTSRIDTVLNQALEAALSRR